MPKATCRIHVGTRVEPVIISSYGSSRHPARRSRGDALCGACFDSQCAVTSFDIAPASWRADHHMHLASVDLCRRVGECLPSNDPPAVFAFDAVRALDERHVAKGVILSCAYLYGLRSLHLQPSDVAKWTRIENEFTAGEVAKYPTRLVGFLSVDPLQDSAIDEMRHWHGRRQLVGLKLHFNASDAHVRDAHHRRKIAGVLAEAAAQDLPIVIHTGRADFNASDAELFIRDVLPSAGHSWVQIAHAGGFPRQDGNNAAVLRTFGDHIVRDDPATRHVFFDLACVPVPGETRMSVEEIARQVRRIGIRRFLFGSDFNVLTPAGEVKNLRKLGLTDQEWQTLQENCAPWAC
jgi:predicted TIM-barrel fold metal-dependent hydrolase